MAENQITGHKTPGQAREVYEHPATGAAAISESLTPSNLGNRPFKILGIRLHFDSAPSTSENFTVTLNDGNGAAYDTVLYKRDLSVGSVTDLVLDRSDLHLDEGHMFKKTDQIDIAFTNTDTNTYGLVIEYELL